MEVPDIPALVAVAKRHGVLTAIDNTWAAGLLFRPFDHGVDIVMHALTKYPSGGSDVLMGSVTTRDDALHQRLKAVEMKLGYGIGGDDAYLMLRGLATMQMRLERSGANGLALAQWMAGRPEIAAVLHPAFPDCPGHAIWQRDFSGSAGLFSVIVDASIDEARVDAMIDALALFGIGFSWGGMHSLAVPYRVGLPGGPARDASRWPHRGVLVRFYAGTEDAPRPDRRSRTGLRPPGSLRRDRSTGVVHGIPSAHVRRPDRGGPGVRVRPGGRSARRCRGSQRSRRSGRPRVAIRSSRPKVSS